MKNILVTVFLMICGTFASHYEQADFTKLRSAAEYDYPPFCIVNEDSTADGFSVELLKAACEAMKIEVSFKVGEWNVIKHELADGKLDVLPLVGRTPENEMLFDFTFPYMTYHGAVFARTGEARFKTRQDLKNAKLMVMKGDNAEDYSRRVKLSDSIRTTPSFEEAFRNLSEGNCDIVVTQKVMGLNLLKQTDITNIVPLDLDVKDFQQNFCFAVTAENKKLLELINEGLSIVIANGAYDRIHKKWFEPVSEIGKTRITIGVDSNYPPFSFINEKGNLDGYNVDLTNAIAKQLGIIIDIKPCNCYELKDFLTEGEIDAAAGMYYSDLKAKYIKFSPPHIINDHVIIARADAQTVNEISGLKGKKVLVMKDDVMHDYLLENGLGKEANTVKSQEEVLSLLSEGKFDYALTSHTFAHYYIEKNKILDLQVIEKSYVPQEYCFAATKNNEALMRHITDAIAVLKESGEYRKIYSKWMGIYHETGKDYGKIIRYLLVIFFALFLLTAGFYVWNRSLKNQVDKKTKELAETEYIFTKFMENSPIYVFFKDINIRSLKLSKNYEKMTGKPLSEILNKNMYEIFPSDLAKKMVEDDKRVLNEGKLTVIDEEFNGRQYTTIKFPIYDKGEPKYLAGYTIDVTDRIIAQNKIIESEEKYRQVFDSASEGIFMTKTDGSILSANPEACRILGRTEKDIIELGRDKLFDTDDTKFAESLEIRRKKGYFKGEVTAIVNDGTRIPVMLTSSIYHDSKGEEKSITIFSDISERKEDENRLQAYTKELEKNKNAMLNILKDVNLEVTERRKAQEELKKLNTELEERVKERTLKLEEQNKALSAAQESLIMLLEDVNDARKQLTEANEKLVSANKELEAFSYSVSHDLRSPLRAIVGFSDILMEDYCNDLNDEGKRYIERITENTQKMQKLIDDLLEYSRVGKSSVRLQKIETVKMLTKIFEDIKAGEGERKFDFSVNGLIPEIMADRTLVTQMFQNLIGNAVKFTGKKEVAVIKINYENDGIFHIISIKDNGAGFDEKYKSKLFEVFQRLHSTEDFPGTGVGLSIVYKVATKHGWSLDAESKNGDGAVFYIKIPVEQKKEPQIEERI